MSLNNFPGSKWWSFDFHNHSPASSDYNAAERGSLSPRDWLLAYMRANIDCVAVTDHNTGDWIDRLKSEYLAMQNAVPQPVGFRDLFLFPGIEVTTSDGLHVLALFDPAETSGKTHAIKALSECVDRVNNAESICRQGALQVCQHVRSQGGIAVLAHAEEVNGIFEGSVDAATGAFRPIRGAREIEQILAVCDGIETHAPQSANIQHFADKIKQTALVDGSDAHRSAGAGSRFVWIKMGTPSIEGLRLALMDPECSLIRPDGTIPGAPPEVPSRRVVSLEISQLYLRRQSPMNVHFSPWFNTIIGGRGSGKSTLLETIRLGLARDNELDELGDESDVTRTFKRFKRIGGSGQNSGMLVTGTSISIQVEKREAGISETYLYHWSVNGLSVKRQNETGNWDDTGLNSEQARATFPIKIFSQKQIFELSDRPSALLTYIDSSTDVNHAAWQRRHDELKQALRDLRARERLLLAEIGRKAQVDVDLKEVSRKTLAYQQSNVASQVTTFRENQDSKTSIDSFINSAEGVVFGLEGALGKPDLLDALKIGNLPSKAVDPTPLTLKCSELVQQLNEDYKKVHDAIQVMRNRVDAFKADETVTNYVVALQDALANYRAEVDKLAAQGVGTAQEAEASLKKQQALESDMAQILKKEEELEAVRHALIIAYADLKFNRNKLTRSRQAFVDSVLAKVSDLRITISGQADVDASCQSLRTVMRLQDGTFIEDILGDDDEHGNRQGLLGKLVSKHLHDPVHKRVTSFKLGILERNKEILGEPVHGRLLNALNRLSSDDDDAIIEWFPEDKVVVEYRRDARSQYQSLDKASAGQKTSAILSFLLAHGNEPLILDQPEDDLDNALVYALVVKQIRENKSRRQIIVVTHNPNIVVNGDSELVMPMEFKGGQIHLNGAGALQERAVREKICEIMEGGKVAFQQRYKRILTDLEVN